MSHASVEEGSLITLAVALDDDEVARFLGYPAGRRPEGRMAALFAEALSQARRLVRARGAFRSLAPARAEEVGLETVDAERLVVGLVTAGSEIEERASTLLGEGDSTLALLLDAAGSAAAEEAADRLSAIVTGEKNGSRAAAARVGCRVSPGYGPWKLESQRQLFRALPHVEVGVSLTESLLMVPRKSISFAMWLGERGQPRKAFGGCESCGLETCRHRRPAREKGAVR